MSGAAMRLRNVKDGWRNKLQNVGKLSFKLSERNQMKIVSWNINSLRLRLPLLKKFIEEANPDVICLQEIKVSEEHFPHLEVRALGFEFVEFSGEKSYNGVAILSKFPLTKIEKIDIENYGHKRHISGALQTKQGEVGEWLLE